MRFKVFVTMLAAVALAPVARAGPAPSRHPSPAPATPGPPPAPPVRPVLMKWMGEMSCGA